MEYDTVTVRGFAYLDEVAQIAGVPCSHLVRLNPELIRQCTPPGAVDYALKVPKGTAQRVADHLHKAYDPQVEYVTHTIQKGDTLIGIGRKYSTTARDIAKANRMETNEVLSIGRTLVVPKGTAAARPRPGQASSRGRERRARQHLPALWSELGGPRRGQLNQQPIAHPARHRAEHPAQAHRVFRQDPGAVSGEERRHHLGDLAAIRGLGQRCHPVEPAHTLGHDPAGR